MHLLKLQNIFAQIEIYIDVFLSPDICGDDPLDVVTIVHRYLKDQSVKCHLNKLANIYNHVCACVPKR